MIYKISKKKYEQAQKEPIEQTEKRSRLKNFEQNFKNYFDKRNVVITVIRPNFSFKEENEKMYCSRNSNQLLLRVEHPYNQEIAERAIRRLKYYFSKK